MWRTRVKEYTVAGEILLDGKVQSGQGRPLVVLNFLHLIYHIFSEISIGLLARFSKKISQKF